MMRGKFHCNKMAKVGLFFTLILLCSSLFANDNSSTSKQPNIILFLVDDMGWQETSVAFHTVVTKLNKRYHTPNMDRLAMRGIKFTQAYACAVCSPSRVSLMTGLNAARHKVTTWTLRKDISPEPKHPTLIPPA